MKFLLKLFKKTLLIIAEENFSALDRIKGVTPQAKTEIKDGIRNIINSL